MAQVRNIRSARRTAILTSLSASAAALVVGQANEAKAEIIVANPNVTVGFGAGDLSSYTFTAPTGAAINFANSTGSVHSVVVKSVTGSVHLRVQGLTQLHRSYFLGNGAVGKTYGKVGTTYSHKAVIAQVDSKNSLSGQVSVGTTAYFAFKFYDYVNSNYDYGYIQGTLTDGSFANYAFHIDTIAYDDSGAVIGNGDLPNAAVPEPSSLALSAIGALVMGAAGLRKWKQDKAKAVSAPAIS